VKVDGEAQYDGVGAHLDMVTPFLLVLLQPQRFVHPCFSMMAWLRLFLYGGAGFG